LRGAVKRALIAPLLVAAFLASIAAFAAPAAYAAAPVPLPPGFQGMRATVLGDVCNLREIPDTSADITGTVTQGTVLEVVNFQNNWAKVKYQGKESWIAGWLVDIDLGSAAVSARVIRTDVNLREGPGIEFAVKYVTQKDSVYPAEVKRGYWIRVSLPGGEAAWISEGLLQLESERAAPSTVKYEAGDLVVYPAKDTLKVTRNSVGGSEVVGRLSRGESARLIDCEGAWVIVEMTGGARGWVYGPDARISAPKDPSIAFTVSDSAWTIGKYPAIAVTHTDVNFRSGPGTSYPVVSMLSDGDILRVLECQGEWTKAISPGGITGWVATWLTSENSATSAPTFAVSAEAAEKTRLLTVTGPFANAEVIQGTDGRSAVVSTSAFFNASATLPVNSYEFGSIKVSGSDITLSLKEKSRYTVKSNGPGKVVLEFAPAVTSVNVQAQDGADVLTIGTLGYAVPEVTRNGDSITFFLPGASCAGAQVPADLFGQGQLIKSVSVAPRSGGTDVTLKTPGNVPYLLKKTSNTIEARFGSPGLAGKRIIVDPGHEAEDPGAIGPTGLSERNVNWEIALRLADLLKKAGANAVLTRNGLYQPTEAPARWTPGPNEYTGALAKRAAWSLGADLFISIHNDYNSDRSVAGTTSYVSDDALNSAESRRLAALVQRELTLSIGTQDNGIRDSDLYVVRESSSPAVLVETMYISNPREEAYLRQAATWDKEAAGLFRAIQRYFTPGL